MGSVSLPFRFSKKLTNITFWGPILSEFVAKVVERWWKLVVKLVGTWWKHRGDT